MPRLHSLRQFTLATALAAVTGSAALACGMETSWTEADYNAVFADSIVKVETAKLDSDPSQIRLTVDAEVPTGGYSHATLEPVYYVVEPGDGIYEIYVMAIPPDGVATQVISTIEVTLDLPADPAIAGYRIIAGNNCVTLMLDSNGLPPPEDGCAVQSLSV